MGDLAIDTAVEGSNGRYRALLNEDWRIWGPMGGYIASVALRAAAAEVDSALAPASFTCQFLSSARFEDIDVHVDVRRATSRTALVGVHISQGDTPVLDAQAWFASSSPLVLHDHVTPHRFGHPDEHRSIDEYELRVPPFSFWENFDRKPLDWIEEWEEWPGGEPEWAEWLRFTPTPTFDNPVLEACRLLLLADLPSFPAAVRAHPGRDRSWIAPSLDLAVQFHRLDDLSDWLLVHGEAPIADRGLLSFRSGVWSASGRLAASGSGQLINRPAPPDLS
jgi:acyl-CoA thioesterase-2